MEGRIRNGQEEWDALETTCGLVHGAFIFIYIDIRYISVYIYIDIKVYRRC